MSSLSTLRYRLEQNPGTGQVVCRPPIATGRMENGSIAFGERLYLIFQFGFY
jgi:hypothetical protein